MRNKNWLVRLKNSQHPIIKQEVGVPVFVVSVLALMLVVVFIKVSTAWGVGLTAFLGGAGLLAYLLHDPLDD